MFFFLNERKRKEKMAGLTTLYIKNMVCERCVMVVRDQLLRLGFVPEVVELGRTVLRDELDEAGRGAIRDALTPLGFELIDNRRVRQNERVRNLIIALVRQRDCHLRTNLSDYLTERLHQDYSALSKTFSEETGTTIEKYYIAQRIERVKELLSYDELSLNEIADRLHYSSAAHLSAQFKSVEGVTPTQYRRLNRKGRKPLDQV